MGLNYFTTQTIKTAARLVLLKTKKTKTFLFLVVVKLDFPQKLTKVEMQKLHFISKTPVFGVFFFSFDLQMHLNVTKYLLIFYLKYHLVQFI